MNTIDYLNNFEKKIENMTDDEFDVLLAECALKADDIPIMPTSSTRKMRGKIVRDEGHIYGSQR